MRSWTDGERDIKVMYVCDLPFFCFFVIEGNVKGSSEAFLGYALGNSGYV